MSKEVFGDNDGDEWTGFSENRVQDIGRASFILGVQMFRETIARDLEARLQTSAAEYIRSKWNPNWGTDPGKPTELNFTYFSDLFDVWSVEA